MPLSPEELRFRELSNGLLRAAWEARREFGAASAEALAAMEKAMFEARADTAVQRAWFDDQYEARGFSSAMDALAELASRPGAPRNVIEMNKRWQRHKIAPQISELTSDQISDCLEVWDNHILRQEGDHAVWARVSDMPDAARRAALVSRITRAIPLHSDHPHHLDVVARAGIDLAAIRDWAKGFLSIGTDAWRAAVENASPVAQRRVAMREGFVAWQDRAVRDGTIQCPCPIDGRLRDVFDSAILHGVAYYAFAGVETFYLLCAGYSMRAFALWAPGRNLMLTFQREDEIGDGGVLNAGTGRLLGRIALQRDAFFSAASAPARRREITLYMRSIRNFAHQVWNFYSGMERLAVAGLLGRVKQVQHVEGGYFGEFADIYPEFPPGVVQEVPWGPVCDPAPYSPNSLVVAPGGYYMGHGLRRRIRDAMAARPARAGAPEPRDASRPIIWVSIRVTDKGWIDQESGTAEFCRRILAQHPNATFVFDGFSAPLGSDAPPPVDWAPAIDRMHEVVASIARSIGRPDQVVSLIGQTMRESIIWAAASDAYVSPLGTSQHKVGWFSDGCGVVYCHPSYTDHPGLAPGCWEAEGTQPPILIGGIPDATGGDAVAVRAPRPKMENLHVDAAGIADAVLMLLEVRLSPAGAGAVA